ncbi:5'/3'-nucleotidase SurE [Mesorhizobium sp.]|uniref:5'/3'-nucleotidase SurE n=1 Tax=Mesorhizobium sp. TaxID=1871066 RepID=UPI000FEA1F9E|nr:5'/3'-nucleotidase SurE [Mesorhizobium sp.]RWM21651.1 MAG: hypothetical protein EOR74_28930 [Mesorhizobium sp.]RWM41047.1 MAG: hypothetical protein EOR75_05855 [Mesorhizobium sp.]TIO73767.1 MAG: hypothetical protein E5X75_26800 [Mesorhizobium sp.]TIO82923.1 MAG: hypothetical protein E5X74_22355 [Mesorhizobium sp.]TJV48719.1 MAG: hypothetical protein E5Y01_27110 [Mesorhizobium sp.]
MEKRLRLLMTNDDGIGSDLMLPFVTEMRKDFDVVAIVPREDSSLTAHSVSMRPDQRLQLVGEDYYVLDGFPADCVALGLSAPEFGVFDAVVAGVNRGLNVGFDVWYSGTVAAAREAALMGNCGIAISCAEFAQDMAESAAICADLIDGVIRRRIAERGTVININVPSLKAGGLRGLAVTRLAQHGTRSTFRLDKTDVKEWRVGVALEPSPGVSCQDDCECSALRRGYASVAVAQRFHCASAYERA